MEFIYSLKEIGSTFPSFKISLTAVTALQRYRYFVRMSPTLVAFMGCTQLEESGEVHILAFSGGVTCFKPFFVVLGRVFSSNGTLLSHARIFIQGIMNPKLHLVISAVSTTIVKDY